WRRRNLRGRRASMECFIAPICHVVAWHSRFLQGFIQSTGAPPRAQRTVFVFLFFLFAVRAPFSFIRQWGMCGGLGGDLFFRVGRAHQAAKGHWPLPGGDLQLLWLQRKLFRYVGSLLFRLRRLYRCESRELRRGS